VGSRKIREVVAHGLSHDGEKAFFGRVLCPPLRKRRASASKYQLREGEVERGRRGERERERESTPVFGSLFPSSSVGSYDI
tara:strand:- start:205 stop:447 length:243 start_codon:yes stop_codon:yes gene_type:complete